MSHAQISAYLLIATGIIHATLGAVKGFPELKGIAQDGLIATANRSPERRAVFWFIVAGLALVLTGFLALGYERSLPRSFGWGLLFLGVAGTIVLGPSGFVLIIPQSVYILLSAG